MASSGVPFLGRAAISGEVPATLRSGSDQALVARLALLMLDHGVIPPQRWMRSARRLENICTTSFAEWVEHRVGALRVLDLWFGATLSSSKSDESAMGNLWIGWGAGKRAMLTIGPAIRALTNVHPRLPGAILSAIHKAGWNSIPVVGFDDQLHLAECYIWGGAEDADEHADDWGMTDEQKVEYLESTITRRDILERTPESAFSYFRRPLKSRSLGSVQRATEEFPVRRIIELAREIGRMQDVTMLREFHRNAAENGDEFVGHGAILRWSDDDLTPDVFQIIGQYAYDSGISQEDCCTVSLQLDDTKEFGWFLGELSAALDAMRRLDELLWLLSAEEWSSYPTTKEH